MKRLLIGAVVFGVAISMIFVNQNTNDPQREPLPESENAGANTPDNSAPYVVVLGVAQDAGYPQAGCAKECCALGWNDYRHRHWPSCLGIVDPSSKQRWILDCTPSFPDQLHLLNRVSKSSAKALDGILLTHAHIGHYTGLVHLGREVMGARKVPVYAMPRMSDVLREHAPWNLLVRQEHIDLRPLRAGEVLRLNQRIAITPMLVPHRGELSETVAFRIDGPKRSALYLPDIDKWEQWNTRIEDVLEEVDVAFLDGTFYAEGEIPGRNMADIPHPFIQESLRRFAPLPATTRAKVHFLHLNHTNPALNETSTASRRILRAGCSVAREGAVFGL